MNACLLIKLMSKTPPVATSSMASLPHGLGNLLFKCHCYHIVWMVLWIVCHNVPGYVDNVHRLALMCLTFVLMLPISCVTCKCQ